MYIALVMVGLVVGAVLRYFAKGKDEAWPCACIHERGDNPACPIHGVPIR